MNLPIARVAGAPEKKRAGSGLKVAVCVAEAAVLAATATIGWALVDGSNLRLVGPVIVAALAVEAIRLPLVLRAPKLGAGGRLVALALAFTLSGLTLETICLGAEAVLNERGRGAVAAEEKLAEAQTALEAAKIGAGRRDGEINRLAAAVAAAQRHVEEVGRESVALQNNPSVSAYRGRRGWAAPGSAAANTAAAANARAQADHARARTVAEADLTAAHGALAALKPVDLTAEEADVAAAKRVVDRERAASPVHRLAASIYQVDPAELTAAEYGSIRKIVILSVGTIISVGTLIAGLVSALPERSDKPSKLARALRAMIAAHRKTLRRIRETVRTEVKEHVKVVHVPVDRMTGLVLDPDTKAPS